MRAPLAGVIPLNPSASNQWVVDGAHSATGQPLLANDTHMSVAMPALWYQVHLSGGRYQEAGVSLPGIPGVVVGHNEHIAWGMTTGWQDAQDLYVEKANPANPREFEFRGQWEKAEIVREVILVKGRSAPVVEEVLITRHGPIISKLAGEEQPLALRWSDSATPSSQNPRNSSSRTRRSRASMNRLWISAVIASASPRLK